MPVLGEGYEEERMPSRKTSVRMSAGRKASGHTGGNLPGMLAAQRFLSMIIVSDAKGEFAIFGVEGSLTQGQAYIYRELGFLGAACTATLFADGVSGHFGPALGFDDLDVRRDFGYADMFAEVNWYNRKALGRMIFSGPDGQDPDSSLYDRGGGLFFFADVDPDNRRLTNVRISGPRGVNPDNAAMASGTISASSSREASC